MKLLCVCNRFFWSRLLLYLQRHCLLGRGVPERLWLGIGWQLRRVPVGELQQRIRCTRPNVHWSEPVLQVARVGHHIRTELR